MICRLYFTTIKGSSPYLGGIVGWNRADATISNVYTVSQLTNSNTSAMYQGAIVGGNDGGTVTNYAFVEQNASYIRGYDGIGNSTAVDVSYVQKEEWFTASNIATILTFGSDAWMT